MSPGDGIVPENHGRIIRLGKTFLRESEVWTASVYGNCCEKWEQERTAGIVLLRWIIQACMVLEGTKTGGQQHSGKLICLTGDIPLPAGGLRPSAACMRRFDRSRPPGAETGEGVKSDEGAAAAGGRYGRHDIVAGHADGGTITRIRRAFIGHGLVYGCGQNRAPVTYRGEDRQ